jgi:transcriptional regulator with XRE-family HTH domain
LEAPQRPEREMLIQKLRLKHGWSQQQLAHASGLSVRTIQRIEAGHPASTETLKALAAVFEVDFSTLTPEQTMTSTVESSADKQEEEAFRYVSKLRGFYLHLFRYIVVVLLLLAINLIVSPQRMWVFWVIGGWGLGIALHAFRVFRPDWLLGPQWERRQVEKRLGRPL